MVRLFDLEMYRSGRNENDSKSFCPEMGTWVRIPPSPLNKLSVDTGGFFYYLVFILPKTVQTYRSHLK